MIHYEGFFITEELPHTLARDIEKKHITTEYKPAKTNDGLYGITADFEIIGYGNDGMNEGYKVRLVKIYAQDDQASRPGRCPAASNPPHVCLTPSR